MRPCAAPLPVANTIPDISETSLFVTPPDRFSVYTKPVNPLAETALDNCFPAPGGGGGTPFDGLYRKAPPERGTFFRLQVYERVGISLVEKQNI